MLTLVAAAILSFMIFFPLVVATSVFKVLDEKQSSKFLRIFFPKYYLYGFVLSAIGLTLSTYYDNKLSMLIFLLIMVGFVFSRQVLMPKINPQLIIILNRSLTEQYFQLSVENL